MTEIFAGTEWYRARSGPEREWRGVLLDRDVPVGPASRTALTYAIVTNDQSITPSMLRTQGSNSHRMLVAK
jgi:hypothetical protein